MNTVIATELKKTFDSLITSIHSFDEDQLNQQPFQGSWTAGQVVEHLLKSYGIIEILTGNTKPTERAIDEKVGPTKEIFLNFDTKMQSPDFIIPTENPKNKQLILEKLKSKANMIIEYAETNDLSPTCLDFELPVLGPFTRLEWLWFINFHTLRHTNQIKTIQSKLLASKTKI